jgi:glucokinase
MKNDIAIGIDIGGTKISASAVQKGEIIGKIHAYKTPLTTEGILSTVLEAVETINNEHKSKYVGIATAGAVNLENTTVIGSTGNLPQGYSNIEFKKIIEKKFNLQTLIENDANAAAWAEYRYGAAKGHQNTIIITLGTGIGGGIVVNGQLLRGKSGSAAEVGHMQLSWKKERKCTCGAWDCWEAYASGTGYAINAGEMALELKSLDSEILKTKQTKTLTTHDIIEGLKNNDPFAQKVHERWEKLVLTGLIGLANVFDPESIVISGGMAKFLNFEKIEKQLNSQLVVPDVKILHASMDNNAGMIGAAMLAVEKL